MGARQQKGDGEEGGMQVLHLAVRLGGGGGGTVQLRRWGCWQRECGSVRGLRECGAGLGANRTSGLSYGLVHRQLD